MHVLSPMLTERHLDHIDLNGTLSVALQPGYVATLMPQDTGWWAEVYQDGSHDTPLSSMHVDRDAEAADLMLVWKHDLQTGDGLTARCECGRIVSPETEHACGHTE